MAIQLEHLCSPNFLLTGKKTGEKPPRVIKMGDRPQRQTDIREHMNSRAVRPRLG